MRRFFFDPETRKGDFVTLSPEESKHAIRVLRLQVGTPVELLDGMGTVFSGEIESTGKIVHVRILGVKRKARESDKTLLVCQGILKGEKMDTVVQKCTELGVEGMFPFHSSRCRGKLELQLAEKKLRRWQRIGLAACKQCYRAEPMGIEIPAKYDELITASSEPSGEQLQLMFWEEESEVHLRDIGAVAEAATIKLLLGPEGGFSAKEVEMARSNGWRTVSLGERILRAETATLTAVSIVQYLSGNL